MITLKYFLLFIFYYTKHINKFANQKFLSTFLTILSKLVINDWQNIIEEK